MDAQLGGLFGLTFLINLIGSLAYSARIAGVRTGRRSSTDPEPSEGGRAAMILVNGAPVELIWFRKDSHHDFNRDQQTV